MESTTWINKPKKKNAPKSITRLNIQTAKEAAQWKGAQQVEGTYNIREGH
jgi:hypothetical protein